MKSLPECEKALATYSSGPIILVAGRDAVAHAKALLEAAKYFRSLVDADLLDSLTRNGNPYCEAIAKAEGKP